MNSKVTTVLFTLVVSSFFNHTGFPGELRERWLQNSAAILKLRQTINKFYEKHVIAL